ncbi:hypothetical protein V6Z11_D06G103600 [Gossypium hirsutum]
MPTTFPFPSSLFCLPVILFAETRTSAPLYHILVFVPQFPFCVFMCGCDPNFQPLEDLLRNITVSEDMCS